MVQLAFCRLMYNKISMQKFKQLLIPKTLL